VLSSKAGKEAYIQPVIIEDKYYFTVKLGKIPREAADGTKLGGSNFRCLMSGVPIEAKYIRAEAQAGRMGTRLLAVIAETSAGRTHIQPTAEMEHLANSMFPNWKPDLKVPTPNHDVDRLPMYGMPTWGDAFDQRQLVALTTFADLVKEVRSIVLRDVTKTNIPQDSLSLERGGSGSCAYADSIATYIALAVGRSANYWSSFTPWAGDFIVQTFGRQAIRMVWDHAEANPFSSSTGNWGGAIDWVVRVIQTSLSAKTQGVAAVADAQRQAPIDGPVVISTDPPYYDNINYADLSDFFYVWLRPSLREVFPSLFATRETPKADELVASSSRHGTKKAAENFFLEGMTTAMRRLVGRSHPAVPITIYYAFKQAETRTDGGTISTGWETFLEAVLRSGLAVTGTWPMRTERDQGLKSGTNVLASSIILVCQRRPEEAPSVSRRVFLRELNQILPEALDEMTRGSGDDRSPVAPVDLSQAIIGPGMAVFSKYAAVLEADGTPMKVGSALELINRFLAEDDFDHDTQFCLHWFEQYGWKEGRFGEADTLARAKGTSVDGVKHAGVISAAGGIVRLLKWGEYPSEWNPAADDRLPVWEVLHHLIRVFKADGETGAGKVLSVVAAKAEATRQLAYRLYTLCERAGWAEDARAYNEIITSWSAIEAAATAAPKAHQSDLFG
jgi:putative DNA methylase